MTGRTALLIVEIDLKGEGKVETKRNVVNKDLKYLIRGEQTVEANPERIEENRMVLRFNLTRLSKVLGKSEDEVDAEVCQCIKTWFEEVEPKIVSDLDFITYETYFRLMLDYVVLSLGLMPNSKIRFMSEGVEEDDTAVVKVKAKAEVYE